MVRRPAAALQVYSNSEPPFGDLGDAQDTGGYATGVYVHNGEFHTRVVDLEIPGRGFNWRFERSYRSGVTFDGPLGHNWDFADNRRLWVVDTYNLVEVRQTFAAAQVGDVVRHDGLNRADLYVRQLDGSFQAPAGFFTRLVENLDGSFSERDQSGTVFTYLAPDGGGIARIDSITDRNGNRMKYLYDGEGQLDQVVDTLGRAIDYTFDAAGRVQSVTDFFGRTLRFGYDGNGDLATVTSPDVTGTPTGNDFPDGKTVRYSYSSGLADARLNHNLLTITAPNEVATSGSPRVVLVYDTTASSPDLDRVQTQTLGGSNISAVPSGGTITYTYGDLGPALPDDFATPVFQTTVEDRNGNVTNYFVNQRGNIVLRQEDSNRDLRPSDPDFFETSYRYNGDYLLQQVTLPEGNTVRYVYQRESGRSTGSNLATTLNDTTKDWVDDQWAGRFVEITGGTGAGQLRLVTGNTPDQLTVNLDWTTTPDATSTYAVLAYYQVESGTSSGSNGTATLNDTAKSWADNQWAGRLVEITGGTGAGQVRRITGNTSDQLTVDADWTTTPDETSTYLILRANRFEQGNLLSVTRSPDEDRGGDQERIRTTYTYEPIYNQLRTMTDPRGNDPDFRPPLALPGEEYPNPQRYTTVSTFDYQEGNDLAGLAQAVGVSVGEVQQWLSAADVSLDLGDLNGDLRTDQIAGNVIRIQSPTVNLLPGSNQAAIDGEAQLIIEQFTYNDFGQLTRSVDPELNVDQYVYYPENDPDGDGTPSPTPPDGRSLDGTTGGYLRQMTRDAESATGRNSGTDPTPTRIRQRYFYDAVGNVIRAVDGRGIATDYAVNQLNQVVQITRAAAHGIYDLDDPPDPVDPAEPLTLTDFQYLERFFYDFNDNLVLRQVEDRGNTSSVDGNLPVEDLPALLIQETSISSGGNLGNTLTDTSQSWATDEWAGLLVQITAGTGVGQVRAILSNTATELTVDSTWAVTPDATSSYAIYSPLDADPAGGTAFVDVVFKYDLLDRQVEMVQEVTNGVAAEFLRTRYRYDPNGNQVLTILPEGNATSAIYDERDLLFRTTRGALTVPELDPGAPGGTAPTLLSDADLAEFGDPPSFDVRGGIFCQCITYHYDGNRNVIETVDAADTDGSPDNNSDIAGPGDRTRFVYDGFDRPTSTIDSVGNQSVMQYDPAGNIVRVLQFGPVGGPSPTSDGPDVLPGPVSQLGVVQTANLVNSNLLAASERRHDELNRVFQTDQVLFVNTIPLQRAPDVRDGAADIGKGNLTPDDVQAIPGLNNVLTAGQSTGGNTNTTLSDSGQGWSADAWAGRVVQITGGTGAGQVRRIASNTATELTVDAAWTTIPDETSTYEVLFVVGRVTSRPEYDRNSRLTFTVQDDGDTARAFYDGVGRVIQTVDPEGNTVETAYDDNSNVIEVRETDVSQVPGVASEVFLTTNFHDSLDRLERRVDNLGQTFDYRYDSRDNLVAMADAQGPVTGATVSRRAFSGGALTVNAINDFGNVTLFFFDGLSRQTLQEVILTASGQGDGTNIGATLEGIKTTTPSPDPAQGGGDGIIRTGFTYDRNSLQSALIDDQGNVTVWLYDNLNRRVAETKGLVIRMLVDDGTSTGANESLTLNDTNQAWGDDQWAGRVVEIVAGTGAGQRRRIASNTSTALTLTTAWDVVPDDTSVYQIYTRAPLDKQLILGDRQIVTPTVATIDDPAVIPEDQVNGQLTAAEAQLDALAALFPALASRIDPPTTIVFGYNEEDNLLILEDENDTETFARYDALNRRLAVRVFRAGQSDAHAGDPVFAPAPVSDPSNASMTFTVVGTTRQDFEYDGLSRQTRATDDNEPNVLSDNSAVTWAYDSLSRVIEEVQGRGGLRRDAGTSTGGNDPNTLKDTGKSWVVGQWEGMQVAITSGLGAGQVRTISGNTNDTLGVDVAWDVVPDDTSSYEIVAPLPDRAVSSAWRAENLRSRLTYPDGRVVLTTYDDLDRIDTVADQGAALPIADYDYIGTGRVLQRVAPLNGTRMTYLDDSGTVDVGYDGLRRPVQLRHLRDQVAGASTGGNGANTLNDTTQAWRTDEWVGGTVEITAGTGVGQVRAIVANTATALTVDSDWAEVPDETSEYVITPPVLVGFTHSYDRMSNKLDEVKLHDAANSEFYAYDSAYRLTSFDRGSGQTPLHSDWTLDGTGNWTAVDGETREHSSFNEIVVRDPSSGPAVVIESDDNGNEIANGTFTFQYDFRNRLRTARNDQGELVAVYAYDAADRRISRAVTNSGSLDGVTQFYLDGAQEIEERDGADGLAQQYVFGIGIDEPLVLDYNMDGTGGTIDPTDQRLFYHQNTLGSVFALTDSSATRVEGYLYDAYGRQTIYTQGANGVVDFGGDDGIAAGGFSVVHNPFLFTGRRLDGETKLYYYRARYLDAEQGRFIQRDPTGYAAGDSNLYRYVANNPTNATDPTGLQQADKPIQDTKRTLEELEEIKRKRQEGFLKVLREVDKGAATIKPDTVPRLVLTVTPATLLTPTKGQILRIVVEAPDEKGTARPVVFGTPINIIVVKENYNKWTTKGDQIGEYKLTLQQDYPPLNPDTIPGQRLNPADPTQDQGLPIFVIVRGKKEYHWGYVHVPIYKREK